MCNDFVLLINWSFAILLTACAPAIYEYIKEKGLKVKHILLCILFYRGVIIATILGGIAYLIYFIIKSIIPILNKPIIKFNKKERSNKFD